MLAEGNRWAPTLPSLRALPAIECWTQKANGDELLTCHIVIRNLSTILSKEIMFGGVKCEK